MQRMPKCQLNLIFVMITLVWFLLMKSCCFTFWFIQQSIVSRRLDKFPTVPSSYLFFRNLRKEFWMPIQGYGCSDSKHARRFDLRSTVSAPSNENIIHRGWVHRETVSCFKDYKFIRETLHFLLLRSEIRPIRWTDFVEFAKCSKYVVVCSISNQITESVAYAVVENILLKFSTPHMISTFRTANNTSELIQ